MEKEEFYIGEENIEEIDPQYQEYLYETYVKRQTEQENPQQEYGYKEQIITIETQEQTKEKTTEEIEEYLEKYKAENNIQQIQEPQEEINIAPTINEQKEAGLEHRENLANYPRQLIIKETLEESHEHAEAAQQDFMQKTVNKPIIEAMKCMERLERKEEELNKLENKEKDIEIKKEKQDKQKLLIEIEKEKENLKKAIENLMKSNSLGDLLRALYILDDALFEVKQRQEKPEQSPLAKLIKKNIEEGKPLTPELGLKIVKGIKNSNDDLSKYINKRNTERELHKEINKDINLYKNTASPKQKDICMERIKGKINHINENEKEFKIRYPKTLEQADKIIKTHKQQTKSKDRTR